jgi:predicted esterase
LLIEEIMQNEMDLLGGFSSKIYLGGFGQGCTMAVAVFAMYEGGPLGGVYGTSGIFCVDLDWDYIDPEEKRKTPLYFMVGDCDPIYDHWFAKKTFEQLAYGGIDHFEFRILPGMQHALTTEGLEKMTEFFVK